MMSLAEALLVFASLSGLLAVALWVRVAASHSLLTSGKLDGTEKLAERANRRALSRALIASAVAVALVLAAYFVGGGIGAI